MSVRTVVLGMLCLSAGGVTANPQLYRAFDHESPVRGAPDELLLLGGYGFAADDQVVYAAIANTTVALRPPNRVPADSGPASGVVDVVSTADIPYSLTIKLPQSLRTGQAYALWVHDASGAWSQPVMFNDVRPGWLSPAFSYATKSPAFLPRTLTIVGRNLQPSAGHSTQIELVGPDQRRAALLVVPHAQDSTGGTLQEYVAKAPLPARLHPGTYHIRVNRDGAGWVALPAQTFEVRPDPEVRPAFGVDDSRFGGCRPDDGLDDTACVLHAIAAAALAGGGSVVFGPGTWDLIDGRQPGLVGDEGIVVHDGVDLEGAGSTATRLVRHAEWSAARPTAAITLTGHNTVTGFTFTDAQTYHSGDVAGPFLQLGAGWPRFAAAPDASNLAVTEVTISRNTFDKPYIAIGGGGLPLERLFITYNSFGAYHAALELAGDQFNVVQKFRVDDAVIDDNVFEPGSELDLIRKTGTIAAELGAGHRMDFSANTADGTSMNFLQTREDAKGWRAAFFWSPNGNFEDVLISANAATCTGDKIGDGEAFGFDNNLNTFAFDTAPPVRSASPNGVTVSASLASRQHDRDVSAADYYVGHWIQVVAGPGLGQARKITGYTTDARTHATTFRVMPAWDVIPASGATRIAIGREYWQLYVIGNRIDNRKPLCQKSNRTHPDAGAITLWAQTADSVVAGNQQYDSDGIYVHQVYVTAARPCPTCTMQGHFHAFLEIRDNLVDGEYDWANDCSRSGISLGVAASPWEAGPPPTVGFGVSVSHNTVRRADGQYGGGIAQLASWYAGPEPHRWPLSDNVLIQHNSLIDIDGPRAIAFCHSNHPRMGIAFPDAAIAWRTVLYANSCNRVTTPIGAGGIDTVRVCPSPVADSCECPPRAP